MKWTPILNCEEKIYIMGKVKGQIKYLRPDGRIVEKPYLYDDFFSALIDLKKFVPEERREEVLQY